jgi:hypothetical protein
VAFENSKQTLHFQNLILGRGEAGEYIAWTLAKSGERTAVIERRLIGGSCPNIACLPSKNIIRSAKVDSLARRAAEFGLFGAPDGSNGSGSRPQAQDGGRPSPGPLESLQGKQRSTDLGRGSLYRF